MREGGIGCRSSGVGESSSPLRSPSPAELERGPGGEAKGVRRGALSALVLGMALLIALLPSTASAHPLGNFTINRYSRIEVDGRILRITYIVDMAEIPAFQEIQTIDRNGNGKIDDAERSAYLSAKVPQLLTNLHLTLDGEPAVLTSESSSISFPEGQGGLKLLRLTALFASATAAQGSSAVDVAYRDDNFGDRLGWKEVVVRAGPGAAIQNASVPSRDVSHELRDYPQDMLSSPLNVRSARFSFTPAAAPATNATSLSQPVPTSGAVSRAVGVADSAFSALVTARSLSLSVILISLLAAVALGALHGLSPGHGKAIAGAYLVSSRATWKHALVLGLTVTLTHTSSVFLLGLVTLAASQWIVPDRLYPVLNLISGLIVVAIGSALLVTRGRRLLAGRLIARFRPPHAPQAIPAVAPALALAGASAGSHAERRENGQQSSLSYTALGFTPHTPALSSTRAASMATVGGEREIESRHLCHVRDPLSLAGEGGGEGEAQTPSGSQATRLHDHDRHDHHHGHGHEHGHPHLPPGADGRPVTWRSLLALGISGGLLPCPSALVVLLSAIALHRLGFGLVLIVAFSLGLAATLAGIGLLLLYARRLFNRFDTRSALMQALPVVSAAVITLAGLAITATALGVRGLPPI